MNKTVKDRLVAFLQKKGINKSEFGRTIGVSNAFVSSIRQSIHPDKIGKIAIAYPDLNIEWLLTGEGEMLSDGHKVEQVSVVDDRAYYTYLLPMSAAGGSLSGFPAEGAKMEDCEKVVSPIADVDFAITVYGDSMYPDYPSGARILIKKIDPSVYIAWGNVFVLDTANGVIVKELQPSEHEGKLLCHSLNPNGKYKDFEVSLQDINGMYRVLACVTMK